MIWLIITVILVLIAIALFAQGAKALAFDPPINNMIIAGIWILGGVIVLALALGGLPPLRIVP